jgi:hypothetical protein
MSMSRMLVAMFLAACALTAGAQTGWRLPPEAHGFDIAGDITAGGVPMRLYGFVSALPPAMLAARFRTSLGEPLVETVLAQGMVLGRMQQDGYLTVQIDAAGSGSRGIIALTDAAAAAAALRRGDIPEEARRWLLRLPAGTRVLSDTSSRDQGRLWHQLVMSNAASPEINRDIVERAMRAEGLSVVHASTADAGRAMVFTAPGREVIAAIVRGSDGASAIVLHTVTTQQAGR